MPGERHGEPVHGQNRPVRGGQQAGGAAGVRHPQVAAPREDHGPARGLRHAALPGAHLRVLQRQGATLQPGGQVNPGGVA